MIDRTEILELAAEQALSPQVVEKDYVLGWLLKGIFAHPKLAENWIFKGGTCLKKCYFETYRFSEDLDFTLADGKQLDSDFLLSAFREVCASVYEQSGLELLTERLRFDVYENQRGKLSCEGRVYYRGPVSPGGDPPRVKLDLTADEVVVLDPVFLEVHHPYSDNPPTGIHARCYGFEEIFAEKIRALSERCRPRDLYDVIHLYRRTSSSPATDIRKALAAKCEFKQIEMPSLDALAVPRAELEAEWKNMLAHQLRALPDPNEFWKELGPFFLWLDGQVEAARPAAIPGTIGDRIISADKLRDGRGAPISRSGVMDTILFAAANHLCVDLGYGGRARRIEPYSLRRTAAGNVVLYACHSHDGANRSYRIDRIESASVTNQPFVPRHAMELTGRAPVLLPPMRKLARTPAAPKQPTAVKRTHTTASGPRYVYECPMCGRRFTRKTRSSKLRPHKTKNGLPCPSRHALFVATRLG